MISALALTALLATGASPVLTLEEALEAARKNNLDLEVARARLEQAETASRKAWAGYLPTVAVGGAYTRNSDEARITLPVGSIVRDVGVPTSEPGGLPGAPTSLVIVPERIIDTVIQPLNALNGQVEVRQALIAPQLWGAIRTASAAERLAALNVEQARREILFAVAQAYYGATAQQEALRAQQRLLEVNQARVKDTQARFEAGTVTRVALLRAQFDLTRAEQDLVRGRNALAATKLALATLLVRPDADFELAPPPEPQLPPAEADLQQRALEQRADVAAARQGVEVAQRGRTTVWLSYAPSVGLSGVWRISNAPGFVGRNDVWAVSLGASWTLFDGGLREANLREQSARVAESRAQQRLAELRTAEEVKRAQLELETAIATRTRAEQALELARESQRLTDLAFKAGVATYLEVADVNAALTGAEVGLVAERLNSALAALRLLRAVGAFGTEEPLAPVP